MNISYNLYKLKRYLYHKYQTLIYGYCDKDTWSLDYTLAKWLVPRLKLFKKLNNGFPHGETPESWNSIIDEIIWTFEFLGSDEQWTNHDDDIWDRVDKGLDLFRKHLRDLWW